MQKKNREYRGAIVYLIIVMAIEVFHLAKDIIRKVWGNFCLQLCSRDR